MQIVKANLQLSILKPFNAEIMVTSAITYRKTCKTGNKDNIKGIIKNKQYKHLSESRRKRSEI